MDGNTSEKKYHTSSYESFADCVNRFKSFFTGASVHIHEEVQTAPAIGRFKTSSEQVDAPRHSSPKM